jgi:hypothetical protein
MFLARKMVIALLLAAFRIWRRLPPDERRRVLDQGTGLASLRRSSSGHAADARRTV